MSIGTNIYSLRKSKKLTQAQLAEKLGVSEQAVSKWENDISAPDVSLFPLIASFFSVSIDRLFDYHLNSYAEEVQQIIRDSENSGELRRSIEIIENGLARYPNSPDLKSQLAHMLFMLYLNLMPLSNEEGCEGVPNECERAIERAVALCRDVADNCDEVSKADNALDILRNIYCELGDYQSALNAIEKISPENYLSKIFGKAQVLAYKNDGEFAKFSERRLLESYLTMNLLFSLKHRTLMESGEYEKSLCWSSAHEKLASVFDDGCPGFFMPHSIWTIVGKAQAYKMLGDKENCLLQLKRVAELMTLMDPDAGADDYQISRRNPMYFSSLTDPELKEEYLTAFPIEHILKGYDEFFGSDEEYPRFRKNVNSTP